jgi:hypothetical protein
VLFADGLQFITCNSSKMRGTLRIHGDSWCSQDVYSLGSFQLNELSAISTPSEHTMPSIAELQILKDALDAKIAEALAQDALLKKEQALARTKAREAEVAKGLKEIAILMRSYRLNKEHLFKAAQSVPAQNGSQGGGDMLDGLKPGQLREDARFEFERASRSNEPAKRMSVEEMRQFYEKFDNKGAEAS